ncbi:unnamed protein product [Paramecium pentaurelia]|uniref:Uncharacterized protein n=1 Tax=Paramecium pentaurelia TaxID=43138 RepID=A0A8S1V592_9CILI|nr:unnamed protein product [Paramecium pentaurelia]
MGCSSTKTQIEKIKKDLEVQKKNLQNLNEKLKLLEEEIEKLDNQQRYDEADIKDLEFQQLSKEKKILHQDIKRRKKTLARYEQIGKQAKSLEEQNQINKKTIQLKTTTKKLLVKRAEINNQIKVINEEIQVCGNDSPEQSDMEESQYKPQRNRNQCRNQNQYENPNSNSNLHQFKNQEPQQLYPPANQAYAFEPLKIENNKSKQMFQQPLQQSVLTN